VRSQVQFGRTVIPFQVRRSRRRKQVSLVVEPGRPGVLVLAPTGVSMARLAGLVRQRGRWIVEKLRRVESAHRPAADREFVSGESFTYLGRSFRLRVHERREPVPPRLEGGWLTVTVAPGLRPAARARAVRTGIIAWYRSRAAARLPERLAQFTDRLGLPATRVLLRDQARRWGSCTSDHEVLLNWRIVQAPMVLVDYVAAHEAVHLVHRNHTRSYWSELAKLIPDVDARRGELRRRGRELVW